MSLRRATTTVVCLGAVAATFLGAQAAASPPRVGHPRASNAAAVKVPKLTGWSQLSSRGVPSISVPGIVQDGAGAQVVWRQDDTSLTESLRTRKVSGAGRVTTALGTIVSGWSSLNDDPDLVDLPSGRLAVFAGMRSTSPSEKYDGAMYFSTSTNHGGTWSLGNGSLSETTSAGSYGSSVINDGGEPLVATIASSSSYITLHRGISPIPATSGDWTTSKSPLCCAYSVSLGQDSASGNVWALWNSNSNKSSQRGVIAAKVYPTPVTNQQQAPSSLTKGNFDPEVVQPVPAASRRGGGVWTAYKVGYPTANRIRLW